jgi:type I restriction enzyme M protein
MIRGYGGNRKLRLDKKFEIQGEGGSSGTSGIIDKIIATYRARKEIAKYSHRALYTEIEENEFNLNIPRYVDTFEPEPEIDIAASQKEIEEIEAKLAVTRKKMAAYLKDLDF